MRYAHLQVDKAIDDMADVMGSLIKTGEETEESEDETT
jgi:hypothetical protein